MQSNPSDAASDSGVFKALLESEVHKRRTFAIISHPDAGKTTLTEKLLLYSGAIHRAGFVKAKSNQKQTTSDWMEIEKERGISISSTVLQFEYHNKVINLLDTPGHKDFSEDTYRTLMAADCAVMLIDCAKGVEERTKKLFEVCRQSGIPIFTFINKLDREGREPFELIDELEKTLGIRSCPMNWPIGMGRSFRGVYDIQSEDIFLFEPARKDLATTSTACTLQEFVENKAADKAVVDIFKEELELLKVAGDPFDREKVLRGQQTPLFFGSALNNFGVENFLQYFIELAPEPSPRVTVDDQEILPTDAQFSGFIFKVQANTDPNHRDRVAFLRICSGKFERNIDVLHVQLNKKIKLAKPFRFFGQERVIVDESWPGDVVGLIDTMSELRIGDSLSQVGGVFSRKLEYHAIPTFSQEHFARVVMLDPQKRKQLKKGLEQLSEEGVVQVYYQHGVGDREPQVGVVGKLQFDVLKHRLMNEYAVEIRFDALPYSNSRWIDGEPGFSIENFIATENTPLVLDRDGLPVLLFKSDWERSYFETNHPKLKLLNTAPRIR